MDRNVKLERWAHLAEIVASVAVVVTLVFLVVEVRANTLAIERQSFVQRTDRLFEPFIDPAVMPQVYGKVAAVDGAVASVNAFVDRYDMTFEEATTWSRHIGWIWRGLQADFQFNGPSDSLDEMVRALAAAPDMQLYWESMNFANDDFVAYVESIREGM